MSSPFKFLDAYDVRDREIFFGREEEIEQLYTLVFQTRLLLVYGQSGTGKTSLIQCGLANRFKPTDWFQVFVRRKEDINVSLDREIRRHARTAIKPGSSAVAAVRSLYLDHLRPVYLIFDQFEELFILGKAQEQAAFIASVEALLASDVSCKIVIIMREEYIAMLHAFDKSVPTLFNKRLRVEPMSMRNLEQVIVGTTGALGIALEHGASTAQRIIDNLSEGRAGVQLSYLQVYLDKLHRGAAADPASQGRELVFTDALVQQTGALGDVMADFLEEQTSAIQKDIAGRFPQVPADAVQRVMEEFTTLDGTKLPMSRDELGDRLPAFAAFIDACLSAFESGRILRNADGLYELAHDTLASRIAEKRSGERKNLLKVHKLIKDRLSAFEQTRTFLNDDELTVARPHLAQLGLSAAEMTFVDKSAAKVRRRRVATVGATAGLMLILATFTVVAVNGQRKAENAIDLASNATNDLSLTIFDELKPVLGKTDVRRRLLEKAERLNAQLAKVAHSGQGSAPFWLNILEGDIALEKGEKDSARGRFTESVSQARRALDTTPTDTGWLRGLSVALGRLGDLEQREEHVEGALQAFTEALSIDKSLVQRDPGNLQWKRDLSVSYQQLGTLYQTDAKMDKAAESYGFALGIAEELATQRPLDLNWQSDLAVHYMRMGDLERDRPDLDRARDWYARASQVMAKLVSNEQIGEKILGWKADLVAAYRQLSEIALKQCQLNDARTASERALVIARELVRIEPKDLARRAVLAEFHQRRAVIELEDGQVDRARQAALESLEESSLLRRIDPEEQAWQRHMSWGQLRLADAESRRGDLMAARLAARRSLEIAHALHDARPADVDYAFDLYAIQQKAGAIEGQAGQFKAARVQTENALKIARELSEKPSLAKDPELAGNLKLLERAIATYAKGLPMPPQKQCAGGAAR